MPISFKLGSKTKDEPASSTEKLPFLQDSAVPAPDAEPPAPIGRDRRILVVDDNAVVLKAFEIKLRRSGFNVFTASDAATVASVADEAKAELILLDINFPPSHTAIEWNGFTVIQWLRRFPELASIPVILMSGTDSTKHEEKALAAGAAAFFPKPVDYPKLLATMLKCLGDKPA
jgi:CheY-like chemotaxis protein